MKPIFHSCYYSKEHFASQCTFNSYQLYCKAESYDGLTVDEKAKILVTSYRNIKEYSAIKKSDTDETATTKEIDSKKLKRGFFRHLESIVKNILRSNLYLTNHNR